MDDNELLEVLMATPILTLDHDVATDLFRIYGATQSHQIGLLSIPACRSAGRGQKFWTIPARYLQVVALGNTFKIQWTQPAIDRWLQLLTTAEACKRLRTDGLTPDEESHLVKMLAEYGVVPKPNQAAAMVHLATGAKVGLFSETGAGKTVVVAGASKLYELTPVLIVCPPSVLYNWKIELSRFGIEAVILDGGKTQRDKVMEAFDPELTPVLICSYGIAKSLTRYAPYGSTSLKRCNACGGQLDIPEEKCQVHEKWLNTIPWKVTVVDECHRIRDPHTDQTRAIWYLMHVSPYTWGLTGTPMQDNATELWSLLHGLDPVEHPSSTKFRDRYLSQSKTFWGTTEVTGILPQRRAEFDDVTQWHWRRDVKSGMPEVVHEIRTTTMGAKAAKAYAQMKKQLMAEVGLTGTDETGVLLADNHMVKHGRLRVLANATVEVDDNDHVTLHEPSAKLDLMEDTLNDYDEPLLLWFSSVKLLKLAQARLDKRNEELTAKGGSPIPYVTIHGETSARARQQAVEDFQSGKVDRILLNPAAGGEGITLTRARVSINVMRPDSSIQDTQARGRNLRYGVEYDELIEVDLITLDTVEEDLIPKMDQKRTNIKEVLG